MRQLNYLVLNKKDLLSSVYYWFSIAVEKLRKKHIKIAHEEYDRHDDIKSDNWNGGEQYPVDKPIIRNRQGVGQ